MEGIQYTLFPKFLEGNDSYDVENKECRKSKKDNIFGLQYCSDAIFSGKYGIPCLNSYIGEIPEEFITFSDIKRSNVYKCGVSFFDEDEVLEELWKCPTRYVSSLSRFMCVTEPDFSLKIGEPLAVQIANTYRNHAVAYYLQSHGLSVLPTMSWSSSESYEFCFDGYSKHGAVIVSTIGTIRDERSRMYFKNGFFEMLKRIDPDAIVLYGDISETMKSWLPSQLDVRYAEHKRFKRARGGYGK